MLQPSTNAPVFLTEKHPVVTLGEVVSDIENGWSVQCLDRPAMNDEWAILKISAVSTGTFDPSQNKALPPKYVPRPELEVHRGDLVISRCNIARLVGVSAIVRSPQPRLMLCDKLFRVVFKRDSPVEPEFINAVFRASSVRRQIEARVTGTSPTMKNISKRSLLEIAFPLPVPRTQSLLAEDWLMQRQKATHLRGQATDSRTTAWNDFIAAVFG
jgi:type I restriction enzyme S subunit